MARSKRATAKAKGRPRRETGNRELQYNGFSVVVPRSVLKAWESQGEKQLEMIAVVRGHLDRLKNKPVTEGISFQLAFGRVPGEPLSKTAKKLANPGVKEAVLNLLKYPHYRNWHLSPIRNDFTRAVTMAAQDGDQAFFKRLGEILKKPCKPTLRKSSLKEILLFNWVGAGVCFCWFTDNALREFIKLTEGAAPFSMDAIRQERSRLGLLKLRRPLVRSITNDGKRIQLSGEQPVIIADGVEGLEPRAQETDSARTLRAERNKK